MRARASILAAVRAGLGGGRRDPEAIAAEATSLLASPELIRPHLPNTGLVKLFADPKIEIEAIGDMAPPYSAPLDTEMFRALERVAGRVLPGVPVANPVSAGASDRPYWAAAGPVAYGIDPYLVELEESRHSVHGNNERLSLENIEFGLKYYVEVILEMAAR